MVLCKAVLKTVLWKCAHKTLFTVSNSFKRPTAKDQFLVHAEIKARLLRAYIQSHLY